MPRRLYTAQGVRTLSAALLSAQENIQIAARAGGAMEPVLLHRCRLGHAPYDWRATAMVGRFVCRGCGVIGACGACAELRGQRIPPGVVPALCAFHGGLLEIGITDVALAIDFPAPVIPSSRPARGSRTQLTLLHFIDAAPSRKEDVEPTKTNADTTAH